MTPEDRPVCWCGERHADRPEDVHEAATALWHLIAADLRIPQLVRRLDRLLTRVSR